MKKEIKSKLNWKGKIVQKFIGEEPWFYSRQLLKNSSQYIKGRVIDLGCGEKENKHKSLILNLPGIESYTGVDFYTDADIKADLNEKLPINNGQYDTAICFLPLDYLKEPQNFLNESFRILKSGGYLLLTASWIYPYHPEPEDYFRFSDNALRYMLRKSGFQIESISPLGGKGQIISVFLRTKFPFFNKLRPFIDKIFTPRKNRLDKNPAAYFVIAKKPTLKI